jgi:hypothetical protein
MTPTADTWQWLGVLGEANRGMAVAITRWFAEGVKHPERGLVDMGYVDRIEAVVQSVQQIPQPLRGYKQGGLL